MPRVLIDIEPSVEYGQDDMLLTKQQSKRFRGAVTDLLKTALDICGERRYDCSNSICGICVSCGRVPLPGPFARSGPGMVAVLGGGSGSVACGAASVLVGCLPHWLKGGHSGNDR